MATEALIAELERFRGGSPQSETRVLSLISQSTLYLVAEGESASEGNSVTFRVRLGSNNGRSCAYLFSSEQLLKAWCEQRTIPAHPIPISGADLSLVLPKGTSIEVDPGSAHWVTLAPQQIELLNDSGALSKWQSSADDGFKSMVPTEEKMHQQEATAYQPPQVESSETPPGEQPAKKKFFARGSPTTLFAAPAVERKVDIATRPRTFTSSNLKKVVRSNKPDGSSES
jgi:hypothetical protein